MAHLEVDAVLLVAAHQVGFPAQQQSAVHAAAWDFLEELLPAPEGEVRNDRGLGVAAL